MDTEAESGTSKMRFVAREVVADQQRVCAVQMKNIEDKLDGLVLGQNEAKEDRTAIKADVSAIKTAFALFNQRRKLAPTVVAVVAFISSIVALISVIVALIK